VQENLASREALLRNPEFKKDIIAYQTRYSDSYWKNLSAGVLPEGNYEREAFYAVDKIIQRHEKKFGRSLYTMQMPSADLRSRTEARALCQKWDLQRVGAWAWEWIEWLAINWDPTTTDLPSLEPPPRTEPIFALWYLEIEEAPQPKNWGPRKVTLTLKHGVSNRSAQQGLKQALEYLEKSKRRGRPGLTDEEKNALYKIFSEFPLPEKGQRRAVAQKVQAIMKKCGYDISGTTIEREYRGWLKAKNQPIKCYSH
jgi:hypothetical protein